MSHSLTYLGYANAARSYGRAIAIKQQDRFAHMYLIGKTGTGKSHLLRLMALQDIRQDTGLIILDPHGDLVRQISAEIKLPQKLSLLDAPKTNFHFNPLHINKDQNRDLAVASLLSVFQKLWEDSWGPRLEHLLRHVLYTMVSNPNPTLADIPRLLTDKSYRTHRLRAVTDRGVRDFWYEEYARYTPGFRSVVIAPLQNKLGALLTDVRLRTILTNSKAPALHLQSALQHGHTLLFDLSKGKLGEGVSNLLGGFILAHIILQGLERASIAPSERKPVFVYLDEYPGYATSLLSTGLSELRKYQVGLVLAHQYFKQVDIGLRDGALGNVGSLITFRVGAPDAPMLARELAPTFSATDLIQLPNYMVYTRLLIDGEVSKPFSLETYPNINAIPKWGT